MKKQVKWLVLLLAAAILVLPLAGCQSSSKRQKVYVYNWGEYISDSDDSFTFFGQTYQLSDVRKDFEEAYPQYELEYQTFDDNEKMYAKLDTQSYDVIIPSEYMVTRLIREDKLQQLDFSQLPNVEAYMDPRLKEIRYSEDDTINQEILDYAVPYFYCTVGLIYNRDVLGTIDSTDPHDVWSVLFDKTYNGQIGMYNSMRESIGVALNYLGYSLNSVAADQLEAAKNLLIQQRKEVQPIVGVDELKDKYVSGELVAGVAWSGDHTVVQQRLEAAGEDPDVMQYVLPEGSNISVDMMCIPKNAQNVDGALAFINYMYDTEVALKNAVYVGYSSPQTEVLQQLPAVLTSNVNYYPDESLLKTMEVYESTDEIDKQYDEIWQVYLAN
ncbi:ABC transporter substrate-binding protein [Oscillospiraceae bacterium HV4-5-C5C]|nr:ABC transporter substrate-binding protein [Oscillospiraceae bacterium HV4-5-C5C]